MSIEKLILEQDLFTILIQYNTVKPNLVDKPKDTSSVEFFFSISLNRSNMANPLRFGLTVLYCTILSIHIFIIIIIVVICIIILF